MKKLTPIIFLLFMFALTPQANATFFDFEFDPTVTDLFGYMSDTLGSPVTGSNVNWVEGIDPANPFNSNAIFTTTEAAPPIPSALLNFGGFHIDNLIFDYAILGNTGALDFRLDVFNDATNAWVNNFFSVNFTSGFPLLGNSGLLVFDPTWDVTRIRFHDNFEHAVGMDNLGVNVPEPTTLLLLASGLLAMGLYRRKFSNS